MNEEILKMIVESPDGLAAFAMWMNLQWAKWVAGALFTLVLGGVAIWAIRWFILAWIEAEDN